MKLLDIMSGPWMIVREKLIEVKALYESHMRGGKIDIKGIEARVAEAFATIPAKGAKGLYDVIAGTAVIPIKGVISKDMNFFSFFFGGASTREIALLISDALNNRDVESIVLDIDSPGGTVDGTQELADFIFDCRGQKPIVAFSDGMIASAAYYIGAAADQIYISGDMPHIGSIGVVTSHIDYSKQDEMYGIKETEIYAGKYKRISSYVSPLTDEGKEYIQHQVDYIYSIFVNDVAKYRGVEVDTVLKNMADGRIFIGRQAIDAGLVDGVSTFDRLLSDELPVLQSKISAHAWLENFNKELKL